MATNQQWRGRKKDHVWCFMGLDAETHAEYAHCELCGGYKVQDTGKPITKSYYLARVAAGKITGMN